MAITDTAADIDTFTLVLAGLLLVNGWTVLRFWQDKRRARAGERRIAEADLLGLALIGGSPGALVAMQLFRHKTRKEPFRTQLFFIVAVQLGVILGLVVFG